MTVFSIAITTGIILLAVLVVKQKVWPIIRQNRLKRILMQWGSDAEGIVLQVHQTGVLVNNLPQVNIQVQVVPARGQNFVTELKEIIPFTELSGVQPGAKLKVKYNPQNHKQVMIMKNTG